MISFIIDRHSDPRHSSGFEWPPSKRVGGNFIEHRITGALHHGRVCDLPARSIVDAHEKISYPCPKRQITAFFGNSWLESFPKKEE